MSLVAPAEPGYSLPKSFVSDARRRVGEREEEAHQSRSTPSHLSVVIASLMLPMNVALESVSPSFEEKAKAAQRRFNTEAKKNVRESAY